MRHVLLRALARNPIAYLPAATLVTVKLIPRDLMKRIILTHLPAREIR